MEVKKDNSNAADSIQSYRPARSASPPAPEASAAFRLRLRLQPKKIEDDTLGCWIFVSLTNVIYLHLSSSIFLYLQSKQSLRNLNPFNSFWQVWSQKWHLSKYIYRTPLMWLQKSVLLHVKKRKYGNDNKNTPKTQHHRAPTRTDLHKVSRDRAETIWLNYLTDSIINQIN